jgi:hypothetical protein
MLTQYENNMSPIRSAGTLIVVLSLAVAVSYASLAAKAREADMPFQSLFLIAGRCFRQTLSHTGKKMMAA